MNIQAFSLIFMDWKLLVV